MWAEEALVHSTSCDRGGGGRLGWRWLLAAIASCFLSRKQTTSFSASCLLACWRLPEYLFFLFSFLKNTGYEFKVERVWRGGFFCWGESEGCAFCIGAEVAENPKDKWRSNGTSGWATEVLRGDVLQCGKVTKCQNELLLGTGSVGARVCFLFILTKLFWGVFFLSSVQTVDIALI